MTPELSQLMETQPTTVTVIMPVYNAAPMIAEALASLEAQDYPREKMQIVVGDNGSNDGTREIIAEQFPGIEVATATDRGCGYARNAALALAQGKYICCTDADCIADLGWVSALVNAFEAFPEIASFGGQILPYRTDTIVERYQHAWIQQKTLREGTSEFMYAETPNAAFRREVFDQIGLFDGTLGFPDADMGIRLAAAGMKVMYVPNATVRHRNPSGFHEFYRHRVKYGIFMTRLARKYPHVFGVPDTPIALRKVGRETLRRVAGDILYKFPRSLFLGASDQGTRLWPALDATLAVANYVGICQAMRERQ